MLGNEPTKKTNLDITTGEQRASLKNAGQADENLLGDAALAARGGGSVHRELVSTCLRREVLPGRGYSL